jgi:hypothetical protein
MLRILLALFIAASPCAALAAGGGKKGKEVTDPIVDLALVALPVVVKGRAENYVFLQVRLHVAPGQDVAKLRTMEPYYRDALVRAAHRQPFVNPNDWTVVDDKRLKAVMLAEARRISGPKAIAKVEIVSQTPRRVAGMVRPSAAPRKTPPKSL